MSKPIHTPGPLSLLYAARSVFIVRHGLVETIARCDMESTRPMDETGANGRLFAAAYNAFDSAGRELEVNAIELAERISNGGIADLVEALKIAHHAISNLCEPEYTGSIDELRAWGKCLFLPTSASALAKVKGGAP